MAVQKIVTNLWFDTQALEAAEFYCSVFGGDSAVLDVTHYGPAGPGPEGEVLTVRFSLAGQELVGINGGPQFPFTEAVSLEIACDDQAEVDRFWAALTEGGSEVQCGWLKDRYGLSWQVVPVGMEKVLNDPDPARAERAMRAMLGMVKLDLAALQRAADG